LDILARRFCPADRLGLGVARILQLLRLDLQRFAACFQRFNASNIEFNAPPPQDGRDSLEIGAKKLGI
jgi:hypothetical protein